MFKFPQITTAMIYVTQEFTFIDGHNYYGRLTARFPMDAAGDPDPSRRAKFTGEVTIQINTQQGSAPLPLTFAVPADTVQEAFSTFHTLAQKAAEDFESQITRQSILQGGNVK